VGSDFELKVLTLIGRLSDKVEKLEAELAEVKAKVEDSEPSLEGDLEDLRYTLNDSREHLKRKIHERFPDLILGNGSKNLGVKFTISNGKNTLKALIRTSKSFRPGQPSGWIALPTEQLAVFDIYFFVVTYGNDVHTLVISPTDLQTWSSKKKVDSSGKIHFYLNFDNGKWFDDRDDASFDCTKFSEDWNLVNTLL
jgi:hypothetical protein